MRSNDARGPSSIMSFKASSIDCDGGCSSYDCAQIKGPAIVSLRERAEPAGEMFMSMLPARVGKVHSQSFDIQLSNMYFVRSRESHIQFQFQVR